MALRWNSLPKELREEARRIGRRKLSNLQNFVIQAYASRQRRSITLESLIHRGLSAELAQRIVDASLEKMPNDLEGPLIMEVDHLLDSALQDAPASEIWAALALRLSVLFLATVLAIYLKDLPFIRVSAVVVAIIAALSLLPWGYDRILDILDWRDRRRSDV